MSTQERELAWNNPYRARLKEFPGRIFCFERGADDASSVRALRDRYQAAYCEIGSGSGKHAIALAAANPAAAVFGFELRYKRSVRTIEKAEAAGVHNVYVLRTKGEQLAEIFPAGSLDGIFVNFPDPWLKLKHRKHRVLRQELLDQAATALRPGGFLSCKTDQPEYFAEFLALVRADTRFEAERFTSDLHAGPWREENIPTEFEALFTRQGLPICYLRCALRGVS